MLCDCSCDIEGHNDIERETWHQARKQHTCCECREAIEPGKRYQLYTLLSEGHWSKYRTCAPCARLRKDVCACWIFGRLREEIWDCLGFDYVTGEEADWVLDNDADEAEERNAHA